MSLDLVLTTDLNSGIVLQKKIFEMRVQTVQKNRTHFRFYYSFLQHSIGREIDWYQINHEKLRQRFKNLTIDEQKNYGDSGPPRFSEQKSANANTPASPARPLSLNEEKQR